MANPHSAAWRLCQRRSSTVELLLLLMLIVDAEFAVAVVDVASVCFQNQAVVPTRMRGSQTDDHMRIWAVKDVWKKRKKNEQKYYPLRTRTSYDNSCDYPSWMSECWT